MNAFLFLLPAGFGLVLLFWSAGSAWNRYTREKIELISQPSTSPGATVNLDQVNALPPLLKKYFHLVLEDGAPIIQRASLTQTGGFRSGPDMKGWSNMRARQVFSCQPRGFVWDAAITIFPGFSIRVCDTYIAGCGGIRVKLLALFSMIHAQHRRELDESALQRYLAEAVWFPTALLPSQGVHWKALDEHHAEATLRDGAITTTLQFEFNDDGEIVSVYTPARFREVKGQFIPTPWKGRLSNYIRVGHYRIPQQGEVEWHLNDRVYPYWKASLKEINYD